MNRDRYKHYENESCEVIEGLRGMARDIVTPTALLAKIQAQESYLQSFWQGQKPLTVQQRLRQRVFAWVPSIRLPIPSTGFAIGLLVVGLAVALPLYMRLKTTSEDQINILLSFNCERI